MFGARGTKQRQAARRGFRSNSPTKRNFWSPEEQEKRDKERAEWEKNPGKDEVFAAYTQTGKEKATAEWMDEGRRKLEEGERAQEGKEEANKIGKEGLGFNFLGAKGREGREYTLRAIHSYKCKWDARTMHLPPIDMNVPEDQKYRAMRTQITQKVKELGCTCYVAFEERGMRKWIEGKRGEKQAWVTVIDNEDPGPSEEKIYTIFFTKHDEDCEWKGKGEIKLNPISTEKRGRELKDEVSKKTNSETEAQGCGCEIDFDTMGNLETEMKMNQGKVYVVVYEEPGEEEEGLENSQWASQGEKILVQATPDGHDTQSQALPRSRNFTGAKKASEQRKQQPPPFQTPPNETEMDAAMQYVIKTMTGVAARSDQMYRGYLNRVEERNQMMEEIRKEVRKGMEDMRKELREEMRGRKEQEWSGKRKQAPLPEKPSQPSVERRLNTNEPDTEMRDLPPPPKVVIESRKKEEVQRREAAKGEKKYVAPLPGYDDSGTSSGNTPLWSKIAAGKTEWTTVTKTKQSQPKEKEKNLTPEERIRNRNIIIERPKAHKNDKINEQALRDSINGAIKATAATARITVVKITGSGNISIRTDEEHTAEDIWANRKKIETAVSKVLQHPFEMRKDYEREFMKVDSIKLSYANGGGRAWKRTDWNSSTLHALRTDLELSNRGIIVMERPQFIGSLRRMEEEGRTTATAVFAVAKTQELKEILKKGRVTLAAKELYCRKWDHEPQTTICEKCLERGHSRSACGGPAKCKYCGGRHMSENHQCRTAGCDAKKAQLCRHHPKKCTKCGSNQHFGDDPNCSFTPTPTPEPGRKEGSRKDVPEVVLTPASPNETTAEEGGVKETQEDPVDKTQALKLHLSQGSEETKRGRKRTQSREDEEDRTGLFEKTKEELEKERRAFNEKMRKKNPGNETHQHAWCTHKEEEKGGYCDIMEDVHFSHFLTGECKGAEEDGAKTCPAYPEEELEQVEEEIINWEEFLKTPTQQAATPETTLIITKDGHTVIDGEPSPSIAFPKDLPHGNCHCDTSNYERNLLKADCTDIEGICKCYHRTSDVLIKLLVSGNTKIRKLWRASSRVSV